MKRSLFIFLLACLVALSTGTASWQSNPSGLNVRPNIVLIYPDGLGETNNLLMKHPDKAKETAARLQQIQHNYAKQKK